MWWRETAAAAAVAASLAGCGLAPLYGEHKGVRSTLARVEVAPVADRAGQLLRNALLLALPPRRASEAPSYRLRLTLGETRQRLGVEEHAAATRANLILAARFVLEDAAGGAALLSGRLESIASYNIVASPYGALAAERNARARATSRLADAVVARIAAWMAGRA